jgi:uncharacterized membrane protein HdeD (DUF308 family)
MGWRCASDNQDRFIRPSPSLIAALMESGYYLIVRMVKSADVSVSTHTEMIAMRALDLLHEEIEILQRRRGWFIALGVALMILGILAIALPEAATLTVEIFIGWLLLVGGAVQLVHVLRSQSWRGAVPQVLASILYLGTGALLLLYPLTGVLTLTLVLGTFFLIEGALKIIMAFRVRPTPQWGWLLFNGILSLALGWMMWVHWPATAAWAIGLLFGIDLIFSGWAMVMLVMSIREVYFHENMICVGDRCFAY